MSTNTDRLQGLITSAKACARHSLELRAWALSQGLTGIASVHSKNAEKYSVLAVQHDLEYTKLVHSINLGLGE